MRYVFVHGLGQNPSSWETVISYMAEPERSVCPDVFALVEGNEMCYANVYSAFSNYCNAITGPLCLCGLSLGGVLALHYALEHPAKVRSMALIAAQYKMPKALLKFQNMVFQAMPESVFRQMGASKKDVLSLTKSMMHLDFSGRLKDISCGTLILCGEKDHANKQASLRLCKNIPNAELHFIANAKHEINTDSPEKLAKILSLFYQNKGIDKILIV